MADVVFKEGDHAVYDSMNPEEYTFYRIENNDTDSIDPYDVYLGDIQLNNGRYISYIIDKITDLTERIYDLEHPFFLFNDYTVDEVINIINNGEASNYWSVGDATNEIPLNGEVGSYTFDNESWRATIIGFNHNSELETNDCYSMTLQFGQTEDEISIAFVDSSYNSTGTSAAFRMNTSNTNVGGWESSYMRNTICAQFLEALPRSLRNNIKTTTKYTDNVGGNTGSVESNVTATEDKIFLLNGNETGITSSSYANIYEANYSENYSNYYTGSSRRVRHNHQDPSTSISWWTRSLANSSSSNWLRIMASGYGSGNAYTSIGFAPAFTLIGTSPIIINEEAFAIYCADDGSLTFYYGIIPTEGEQYNNKTATKVYTDFEDLNADSTDLNSMQLPWLSLVDKFETVIFDSSYQEATPSSTALWFFTMDHLQNIEGLTYLNTANVINMFGMFAYSSISDVNLSTFNTSNVNNMICMFEGCKNLITLDVSKFDTTKVTNMDEMFQACSNLTTIYSNDEVFVTTNVNSSNQMFKSCSSLVGGYGTTYSDSEITATMAHVDTASNPGYFTAKTSGRAPISTLTNTVALTTGSVSSDDPNYTSTYTITLVDTSSNIMTNIDNAITVIVDEVAYTITNGVSESFTVNAQRSVEIYFTYLTAPDEIYYYITQTDIGGSQPNTYYIYVDGKTVESTFGKYTSSRLSILDAHNIEYYNQISNFYPI